MTRGRDDVLIAATELARLLAAGEPVTILDVRWQLAEPDGRAAYEQGHIPGAVYVSLEDELSDHSVAGRGRHPLPSGRALEAAARQWGVRRDVPVVVYDDWNRAGSARAWWVLSAAGIDGVRILDGGLAAWAGELESGPATSEPGDVVVRPRRPVRGRAPDGVGRAGDVGVATLLDARAPERFRGDVEPIDPMAGHIPGARNAPSTGLLAEDGTFLAEKDLTRLFGASTTSAPIAAPASLHRWSSPRSQPSASTRRCIRDRGRNGVRTQRVPSSAASPPARRGDACRLPSTPGRW